MKVRFTQIAATNTEITALDEQGQVWVYAQSPMNLSWVWKKIESPEVESLVEMSPISPLNGISHLPRSSPLPDQL